MILIRHLNKYKIYPQKLVLPRLVIEEYQLDSELIEYLQKVNISLTVGFPKVIVKALADFDKMIPILC